MAHVNFSNLQFDAMSQIDSKIKLPQASMKSDFAAHIKDALGEVAQLENKATNIIEAFESGQETDVTKVMLAREKSSMAFEATLQIRNKLLSAYKDIISMPV
jgi:flagellar hook-basal body complex protein FliE